MACSSTLPQRDGIIPRTMLWSNLCLSCRPGAYPRLGAVHLAPADERSRTLRAAHYLAWGGFEIGKSRNGSELRYTSKWVYDQPRRGEPSEVDCQWGFSRTCGPGRSISRWSSSHKECLSSILKVFADRRIWGIIAIDYVERLGDQAAHPH